MKRIRTSAAICALVVMSGAACRGESGTPATLGLPRGLAESGLSLRTVDELPNDDPVDVGARLSLYDTGDVRVGIGQFRGDDAVQMWTDALAEAEPVEGSNVIRGQLPLPWATFRMALDTVSGRFVLERGDARPLLRLDPSPGEENTLPPPDPSWTLVSRGDVSFVFFGTMPRDLPGCYAEYGDVEDPDAPSISVGYWEGDTGNLDAHLWWFDDSDLDTPVTIGGQDGFLIGDPDGQLSYVVWSADGATAAAIGTNVEHDAVVAAAETIQQSVSSDSGPCVSS